MVIYKWTDAQGVVHFSDQPVDGAEKIITSGGPTHNGILSDPTAASRPAATKPNSKDTLASAVVSISSPGSQQTFTGNEPIPVRLSVSPALKSTMQVVWLLNGAQVQGQAPDAIEFALNDLSRGTYTIEATVTDVATGESKAADPVTFNVMRPSLLSPQHK